MTIYNSVGFTHTGFVSGWQDNSVDEGSAVDSSCPFDTFTRIHIAEVTKSAIVSCRGKEAQRNSWPKLRSNRELKRLCTEHNHLSHWMAVNLCNRVFIFGILHSNPQNPNQRPECLFV